MCSSPTARFTSSPTALASPRGRHWARGAAAKSLTTRHYDCQRENVGERIRIVGAPKDIICAANDAFQTDVAVVGVSVANGASWPATPPSASAVNGIPYRGARMV